MYVCPSSASSVVICNERGRSDAAGPGAWPVRRPTPHGGTVRLRPVRATPCQLIISFLVHGDAKNVLLATVCQKDIIILLSVTWLTVRR